MPSFDIKEYIPLIDSSQMGPDNWAEIADDIGKKYFDYDGFVVIMGTGKLSVLRCILIIIIKRFCSNNRHHGVCIKRSIIYA